MPDVGGARRNFCTNVGTIFISVAASLFPLAHAGTALPKEDPFADSYKCCIDLGINDSCAENLCRAPQDWHHFDVNVSYLLASTCRRHLDSIGRCLSNGRNQSSCCTRLALTAEHLCFHLCSGDRFDGDRLLTEPAKEDEEYTECLTTNYQSVVIKCILEGYQNVPTPPVNLKVEEINFREASIAWDPPRNLSQLVAGYIVSYEMVDHQRPPSALSSSSQPSAGGGGSPPTSAAFRVSLTHETRYRIKGLTPNTRYAFSVAAESVAGNGAKSQPAPVVHFVTAGRLQTVRAYEPDVYAMDRDDSKTLVCIARLEGQVRRLLRVSWLRSNEILTRPGDASSQNFDAVPDNSSNFVANLFALAYETDLSSSNNYAAILHVKKLDSRDFGVYKCVVTSEYGSAFATINVRKINSIDIPEFPPNITECCARYGVHPSCLFICNNDLAEPLTLHNIMSKPLCREQVAKAALCLEGAKGRKNNPSKNNAKDLSAGACCIRKRIPWPCVTLCERRPGAAASPLAVAMLRGAKGTSSQPPVPKISFRCLAHLKIILECQLERDSKIPSPPRNLTYWPTTGGGGGLNVVTWNRSSLADLYHVFYRRLGDPSPPPDWIRVTVSEPRVQLRDLRRHSTYRLVVLAANMAGYSDSSRALEIQVT